MLNPKRAWPERGQFSPIFFDLGFTERGQVPGKGPNTLYTLHILYTLICTCLVS